MNLDFKYLSKILLDEYILLSPDYSPEELLKDFFSLMEIKLTEHPKLKNQLIIKYFKILRQECNSIRENTEMIIENQELMSNILSQITVAGKTLKREDYANNMAFFTEISKILNEDPLYFHELNIKGDEITYSIIPKSVDAQRLEPIHGSFSFVLGNKDGKIITLEDMLKESERTGEPIIIDSSSIRSVSIYKGNKPPIPEGGDLGHIELRLIPFELPVSVFTPGSFIRYDIILRAEEKGPTSLVLSNYFSESPIKFRFTFNLETGNKIKNNGKFNITCKTGKMDVTQAYKFNKFIRDTQESGVLGLKETKSDKIIFSSHINSADINIASQDQFDLINKLSFIQEITGIKIHLPSEITPSDVVSIEDAYTYYKDGKILSIPKRYEFNVGLDKNYVEKMLNLADENGIFENFDILQEKATINILGIELPLGSLKQHIPHIKTKKPIEELKKELAESRDDTFNIDLIPIGDEPISITRNVSVQ